MSDPLVSVVIPTYNRSSFIGGAVENVLEQTYLNTEIIVIDDGSTDDTLTILKKFRDRIRVVSQANAGPAAARNRGVEIARGEIIAFQDSDDLWMRTKLERQVSLLERGGSAVQVCLCNAEMYFTGKPTRTSFDLAGIHPAFEEGIWSNVAEVLASTFVLFNQCAAIRASALKKIGGFDESLRLMEDHDLALRLALEGNSWAFTREPLVIWRQGAPGSLWQKAMDEEVRLKECTLKCVESFSERAKAGEHAELKTILRRELKRRRRELTAARIGQMRIFGSSTLSSILKTVEHYRSAIYRRTPWCPIMEVRSVAKSVDPLSVTIVPARMSVKHRERQRETD
jgi:glycosyltransferase involved in cell wall biosynthesis